MDIATKTARTRSGEDSQHGRRSATPQGKPRATVLLGALLRRAAEDAGRAPAAAPITSESILATLAPPDPAPGADAVKPRSASKPRAVKKTTAKRAARKRS